VDGVPQLAAYDGQTTLGVLVTNDGKVVSLQSGNGNPAYSNYIASSHVEGQAALWMGENGSTSGTVYINNTNGICGYCNAQISTLLPEGSTLTVVPPEGAIANNSRAIAAATTYVGNSNPIKLK